MRTFTAGVLALALVGCHDHFPMDGTWLRAGVSGDHFGIYILQITDDGTRVNGVACHSDGGYLIFRDVPVRGSYPRVVFDHPAGGRFEGGITSPDTIDGVFQSASFSQEWVFRRATPSDYDDCLRSRPVTSARPSAPRRR